MKLTTAVICLFALVACGDNLGAVAPDAVAPDAPDAHRLP